MKGFRKSRRGAARACMSAAVVAALFATSAQAVTLSNVEGAVSINRGDGFQPASLGTSLSAGDRVRAGASSSVNILYENGCSARVGPNQVVAVLATAPVCQGGSMKDGPALAPAAFGFDPLLAGGLVVGAGVGLAVALSNETTTTTATTPSTRLAHSLFFKLGRRRCCFGCAPAMPHTF